MKNGLRFMVLALGLSLAQSAKAEMTTMGLGVDLSMPYVLTTDGNTTNERGNLNLGVDGRYWASENMNYGLRVNFDVEERTGTKRQIGVAPGVQYHWMPSEMWNPFIRADVPVFLRDQQDIGIGMGAGLAWNLGDAIGVENMVVRYDFDFLYYFGMSDAVPVLALEFFKIGFDYRF